MVNMHASQVPPQFGTPFPHHSQFQQQNGNQIHQGTNLPQFQGDQRGAQGFPALRSQSNITSRRLVLWVFQKGDASTWLKVEPDQYSLSSDILQHELIKFNSDNIPVQKKMNTIGKNARSKVLQLVAEQNESLWKKNADLEWKIVGLNLKWNHNKKVTLLGDRRDILKTIEVILETEYHPFYQGMRAQSGGLHMNSANMPKANFNSQGPPFKAPGLNNQHDHGQRPIQVFDFQDSSDDDDYDQPMYQSQGPRNNEKPSFQQGPNPQFNQPHQNLPGPKFPQGSGGLNLPNGQHLPNKGHQGPSNGPSRGPVDIQNLPPPPGMQGKGQQGMPNQDFRPEFIPPPPPFQGPPQQQQKQQFPPQNQPPHNLPPPPGPNGNTFNAAGQARFPQPETTNPQVLKSQKAKPRTLPGGFPLDIDSDTEFDMEALSGSDAVSAVSIDDEIIVRGRSRNSVRRPSNAREEAVFRAQSIGGYKPLKSAMSPRNSGSNLPMPPLGKPHGNFVNTPSPKPVASVPQEIHIHIPDRTRSKSSDRSPHGHQERERRREKNHERHNEDRERRHRHSEHYISPSSSPRHSFPIPMSRGSSSSSQSDYMSSNDSASSYSSVPTSTTFGSSKASYSRAHGHKQSSYNENMPFQRRGSMRGSQERFFQNERLHNDRRGSLHGQGDYPHKQHIPVHIHHAGMENQTPFPQRPHHSSRRHSMQGQPMNPFNTNQFPSSRPTYAQKQGHLYEEPNEIDIIEGIKIAKAQKAQRAQQYMKSGHRPHPTRAHTFGGGRPYDATEDEWANPGYRM